eukprot:TRINITY_DN6553_c0_g1_i2.p1 TRINITY_DN6553_c0_g1~~TRINITY_DN6553_c0_g1_i2.p1  ORF type:complete len:596 (-),score=76.66 TRINITY_DN6553_c0_g1_i2:288-2075(-)
MDSGIAHIKISQGTIERWINPTGSTQWYLTRYEHVENVPVEFDGNPVLPIGDSDNGFPVLDFDRFVAVFVVDQVLYQLLFIDGTVTCLVVDTKVKSIAALVIDSEDSYQAYYFKTKRVVCTSFNLNQPEDYHTLVITRKPFTFIGKPYPVFHYDGIHIFCVCCDGNIYDISRNRELEWQNKNLVSTMQHNRKSTKFVPIENDEIFPYVRTNRKGRKIIHIFYRSIDGQMHELLKRQGKCWKHVNLALYCDNLQLITQAPIVCWVDSIHVIYTSPSLCEIYWSESKKKWTSTTISRNIVPDKLVSLQGNCFITEARGYSYFIQYSDNTWSLQKIEESESESEVISLSDMSIESIDFPKPPPAPAVYVPKTEIKVKTEGPLFIDLPHHPFPEEPSGDPIRIVIVSDTHNYAHRINMPEGDILIHAGDFTVKGTPPEVKLFKKWLKGLDYEHKVVIMGNHEKYCKPLLPNLLKNSCTFLCNDMVNIYNLNIYGSEWTPDWKTLPVSDILITHKPPKSHGDIIYTGESRGNRVLKKRVYETKPILHIFGHNHEGYGFTCNENTVFVNGANCRGGARSTARRPPIIIDIYPEFKEYYTGE